MKYFLVVYNRLRGGIVGEIEEFADQTKALHARFATEVEHGHDPNIEVVVLGARTREDLESTHARYFKSVTELIDQARAAG